MEPTSPTRRGHEVLVHNVLVVDDSRVMREMIVAALRGLEQLEFTHAASGLEAIERLSLHPFELMVLDVNMPDVNGFEVLQFVRSQDRLRSLPVLVLTSRSDERSKELALAAGASLYMAKPFEPQQLQEAARELLGAAGAVA